MMVEVRVHPGAGSSRVVKGERLEVWVKERAEKGKANSAVVKAVAEFFSIPSSKVRIVRGHSSRRKLLELDI